VIDPARFLHTMSAIPSADALHATVSVLRGGVDYLNPVFTEIHDILRRARGVFDLQYFAHYEDYYRTGILPPGLTSRNPFEDDEENVVCSITKVMKRMNML
jgi:hypothetical protein